ncbi:MAG TPA: type II CAAX endopeptidase family protein [Myxococcaceae bacterium]|nr:type II CAAX endopeptidase family protein [Myxococcaceae bacterium]
MRASGPAVLWRTLVTDTAERADAGARLALEREGASRLDRDAGIVLLTAVLCLTLIQFFGRPGALGTWQHLCSALEVKPFFNQLQSWLTEGPQAPFHARVFWTIARDLFLLGIPAAVVAGVLGRPIADFGLRLRGILPHAWLYLAILALIAPAVVIASYTQPFQATYPFYRLAPGERLWPNFWLWELLYASQFVGIEFFFRGFLVHGLKHRMGYAAVWVSVVPYTMIHFEKPLAECLGAIVAGWVLGTLSLRTGSMWWGAAIHTVVAWGMDLLSLAHQGRLA